MNPKPLIWTALDLLGVSAMAEEKKCVQVFDADTVSIRVSGVGATGKSQYDTTVQLATREIAGTLSQDLDKKPMKRTLDADELANFSPFFMTS